MCGAAKWSFRSVGTPSDESISGVIAIYIIFFNKSNVKFRKKCSKFCLLMEQSFSGRTRTITLICRQDLRV